jgi:RHS repeat-associated protein
MRREIVVAAFTLCSSAQGAGMGQVAEQQQRQALQRSGMRVVSPRVSLNPVRPSPSSAVTHPPAAVDASAVVNAEIANASPDVVYTYDGVGNRESATYKNGVVVLYTYNRRNRLTDVHASRAGALLHRYHYTLDASGLRTRIDAIDADGATTVTTFVYDGVKRLTDETQTRNGVVDFTGHYEYDRTGNRTLATVNGITTAYQYDANDRLTSETTTSGPLAGTTTYSHDAAGNVLTKSGPMGLVTYVYDDAGRLSEITAGGDVVEYQYDYSGLMIGKTWTPAAGQATHWRYVWDVSRDVPQTIEELSAQGNGELQVSATYVFGDGLVSETRDGVTRYVIQDGSGDTRALTDTGGAVTDTFAYDAWGNVIGRTGNTPVSHQYRGERLDPNLGFYYLRARWMDPTVGRFTQMDDYQGKPNEPASLHKYLYANADPVNLVDPTGHAAGGLSSQTAAIGIAAILAVTPRSASIT